MMRCPNCSSASMSVCRSGAVGTPPVFVECGCGWSQAPLDELVIDSAIATWHRANPTPLPDPETFVNYSIGLAHGWAHGPHWVIWKTTFSGKSIADPRSWKFADREAAQDALAEFVNAKAAERGEVA